MKATLLVRLEACTDSIISVYNELLEAKGETDFPMRLFRRLSAYQSSSLAKADGFRHNPQESIVDACIVQGTKMGRNGFPCSAHPPKDCRAISGHKRGTYSRDRAQWISGQTLCKAADQGQQQSPQQAGAIETKGCEAPTSVV